MADSDVLFWAQGLAATKKFNIDICEPDVSPLQLQGPKSREIMVDLFGEEIASLKYYWFKPFKLNGIDLIVSRTGWSSELGYEIFLLNSKDGDKLYQTIMESGQHMGLKPGHTSTIRRIEGAMLSYHADMDINTNPFELGLDRFIDTVSVDVGCCISNSNLCLRGAGSSQAPFSFLDLNLDPKPLETLASLTS